jgi:hypothetical protein
MANLLEIGIWGIRETTDLIYVGEWENMKFVCYGVLQQKGNKKSPAGKYHVSRQGVR